MRKKILLGELIIIVIKSMEKSGFASGTIALYERAFARLQKLAIERQQMHYSVELGQAFTEDSSYAKSEEYCHSRYCLHSRCIQFIESYITNGCVDWTIRNKKAVDILKSTNFSVAKNCFERLMIEQGLKANTKDGYRRLVHYFLSHLEDRGYQNFEQIQNGDIVSFISLICQEHYRPTSLGAHLPGLRMFLKMSEDTSKFEVELPEHLPKKREILKVYTEEEHEKIIEYLENCSISQRDKAICFLALETGLRAVDICNLKLRDIDWKNDCIHIVQSKTGRALNIPLLPSFGNAIAEYLLSERPVSNSEYIFLIKSAPFSPLNSHAACHNLLLRTVTNAGIEADGRIFGTRMTRHSTASRMLRQGVPLPVISQALGHGDPNSAMIYISTEDGKLAECTLPLPAGKEDYL